MLANTNKNSDTYAPKNKLYLHMKNIKILHLDTNHPIMMAQLTQLDFTNDEDYLSSKEEIEEEIENYHGIIIRSRFKIDKQFIDKARNLQFIARVGAGLESIDCDYATSKNIALIAAPEGNRNAVGEHTLAMLLSLLNKLNRANELVKNGQWIREGNRGFELDGKTIGIIGYGNMGKSFAKKLRGFDVKVLCHDILENVADANAKQVSLAELQEKSDVLSLHIPWTETTDKMIDAQFIHQFKKPFWLLNTSRGNNLVTADLVDALKSGKVLGAGLDVLEYEKSSFENLFENQQQPKALTYLLSAENVLLTPHIAGWTFESHEKLAQTIVYKIAALYQLNNEKTVEKAAVTGIGAFMFKAKNPAELRNWYSKYLGLPTDDYGATFWWNDDKNQKCTTSWSPMEQQTTYFAPSEKQFMINFRVSNLQLLLAQLRLEDIEIIGEIQEFEYGKFAWILDLEGNKVELWEPIDAVFE